MKLSSEQFNKLWLFRCGGVGPISYGKLLSRFETASLALKELPELSKKKKSLKVISERIVKKEIHELERHGGSLIFLGEENYPEALANITDPPPVLSVLGNIEHLTSPQIAIVGNRNASSNALKFTTDISKELSNEGFTITSGMARGIDSAAHSGALELGKPTIAVLAGGVDFIYPPENSSLYHHISDYGCVITEMPFGMAPTSQHFPRRNRIISGLSQATLVVEAPKKSGSLITARQALEQGREVFAVPGFPTDPRSEGPNWLIKNGAQVVENVDDILDNLNPNFEIKRCAPQERQATLFSAETQAIPETPKATDVPLLAENDATATLADLLSKTPTEIDEIIRRSTLSEADAIMQLTELEIFGQVEKIGSGYVLK